MELFTLQIEIRSQADDRIWQAVTDWERVTGISAEQVGSDVAANQNVIGPGVSGDDWRVLVWEGDGAGGRPGLAVYGNGEVVPDSGRYPGWPGGAGQPVIR